MNYTALCFNKLTNIFHLHFAFISLCCAKPILCSSKCENHKSPRITRYRAGRGHSQKDSTGSLMTLPSPFYPSLNPLVNKHIPPAPPPSYYHLCLTHSSPVTGCYGNCNQEVDSLHHEWFVLEDEWFVKRSCDGVMLRARLQHQTQISRHFVLL